MEANSVFNGTLVLDICSKGKKIREALWLQDGREPQPLPIYHHLGMFVDTVLIGSMDNGIDVRFYNNSFGLEFYKCNVEHIRIINHLQHTIYVSGLTETVLLQPGESFTLRGYRQ
mgnify:FL=1